VASHARSPAQEAADLRHRVLRRSVPQEDARAHPAEIFERFDYEVLIVDDASEDRTFAIGREYKEAHPDMRVTVLRNEHNQGYGGNQKVGYSYAVNGGFDYVAMVHGDGQYAPEQLPRLMQRSSTRKPTSCSAAHDDECSGRSRAACRSTSGSAIAC